MHSLFMTIYRRFAVWCWLTAMLTGAGWTVPVLVGTLHAQERQAPEYDLKSAFVYNFARFTDYPPERQNGEFLICTAANEQMTGALRLLQGKRIGSRTVIVRTCYDAGDVRDASLLFISQSARQYAPQLLSAVRGLPVLTVGDYSGFRRQGGMINLVLAGERLGFKVNLKAIRAARLRVHPQLLKLAQELEE